MEVSRYCKKCLWIILYWMLYEVSLLRCTTGSTITDVDCVLDDDGSNSQLDACLNKGTIFIGSYLKTLRKQRPFDTCKESNAFLHCIKPMMEQCPGIRHKLRDHWNPFIDHMSCACAGQRDCTESKNCFEEEYSGIMVSRCDAMYRFNKDQRTRTKCHFLKENVNCKDALVTSSCGEAAGLFGYHVFRLETQNIKIMRDGCHVPRDPSYQGLRYGETCGKHFLTEMATCAATHIEEKEVGFLKDNDLIAAGRKKDLKHACRDFTLFQRCMRSVENDICPMGPDLVYNYDSHLRVYVMKMNYICDQEVRKDYADNLRCYQDVLANGTLKQCDIMWSELAPLMDITSSHEFYCVPHKDSVRKMKEELQRLRLCYKEVFSNKCSHRAGNVISELIKRAFVDPSYLRLEFRPDCDIHAEPPSTPAPTKRTLPTQHNVQISKTMSPVVNEESIVSRITEPPSVPDYKKTHRPAQWSNDPRSGVSAVKSSQLHLVSVFTLLHICSCWILRCPSYMSVS